MRCAVICDAMRSTHALKACITDRRSTSRAKVRILFQRNASQKKSLLSARQKRLFCLNYNAIFDTKVSWCILVHHSAVLVHFVVVVHFKQLFRFIAFFLPKRAVLPLLIPLLQRYLFPYQLFVNRNHFACM